MKREDAIFELSRHLMQCGMLMPLGWLETHGKGSKFDEACRMAFDALKSPDVVFCRDCKHSSKEEGYGGAVTYYCKNLERRYGVHWDDSDVRGDFYCADGERRGNDG